MTVVGMEKCYDREGNLVGTRLHTIGTNPLVEGTAVEGIYCKLGFVDCSNVRIGDDIEPIYRYNRLQGFNVDTVSKS